jgi:putative ABC transport system substrate-binding protein
MRRRDFITFASGAAIVWPLATRAQQPARPVIGYLSLPAVDAIPALLPAFRKGLGTEGFVEGKNVTVEYRSAGGKFELLPELAADLVRHRVAVLGAMGPPAALAAKRATQSIPIVFTSGGDPVQMGLVPSFNRPGGNITGLYFLLTELVGKRLALLHELLPRAARVAVLVNPTNPTNAEPTVRDATAAGRDRGLEIRIFNASTNSEIDATFAVLASWRPDALFVGPDTFLASQRAQVVTLAARHALPASYPLREYVEAGGLMTYAPDVVESYAQAGAYAGRILNGTKPGDLPVMQPTRYATVINLKTAKALGIEVPMHLQQLADELIE